MQVYHCHKQSRSPSLHSFLAIQCMFDRLDFQLLQALGRVTDWISCSVFICFEVSRIIRLCPGIVPKSLRNIVCIAIWKDLSSDSNVRNTAVGTRDIGAYRNKNTNMKQITSGHKVSQLFSHRPFITSAESLSIQLQLKYSSFELSVQPKLVFFKIVTQISNTYQHDMVRSMSYLLLCHIQVGNSLFRSYSSYCNRYWT